MRNLLIVSGNTSRLVGWQASGSWLLGSNSRNCKSYHICSVLNELKFIFSVKGHSSTNLIFLLYLYEESVWVFKCGVGFFSGCHPDHRATKRPNVSRFPNHSVWFPITVFPSKINLWCHVPLSPLNWDIMEHSYPSQASRDSEVGDFHLLSPWVNQNIVGFDIKMSDVVYSVQVLQPFQDLFAIEDDLFLL